MFLPSNKSIRRHVVNSLEPYWINAASRIEALPVRRIEREPVFHLPLRLVSVTLPEWATNCGVQECLMIPNEALLDINSRDWRDVDWWLAAFLLLEAWHERLWEYRHVPSIRMAFASRIGMSVFGSMLGSIVLVCFLSVVDSSCWNH